MTLPARESPSARLSRDGADAGDRQDAERDAGDENPETAQPAAQLAPGQPQRQRHHACFAVSAAPISIRPECMCSTRSQRAASAVSCVTSTSVVPRSRWPRNNKFDDLSSRRLVEIAGRLVGDEEGGIRSERAGERDALLLAAGQFGRICDQAAGQPDGGEFALGAGKRVARAGELERHGDVLQRRHGRNQVEALKNDADVLAAEARESILVEFVQSSPATTTEPLSGRSSPVITMSSVDLPEPDGPSRPTASPRPILQVDVAEDMNAGGAAAERQIDPAQRDRGRQRKDSPEMSFMLPADPRPSPLSLARSYGASGLRQIARVALAAAVYGAAGFGAAAPAQRRRSGQDRGARRFV